MKKTLPQHIVIIGCGPSGSAASLFLSKAGIHHTILEKETFPRNKVCGDGCSGKTVFVLKKANPAFLDELFATERKFLPSYGVVFAAPNGKSIEIPYNADPRKETYPPGFTTKRMVFDNFLFEKVQCQYAHIEQNATVQQLERNENGYLISYTKEAQSHQIQAALIIGADGDKGISRKQLLQNNEVSKTSAVGLRGYYKGVKDMHDQHFIELHFLRDILPGYFWIFPLPNGEANVGVCMDSALVRKKKINLREVMLQAIEDNPTISHRFKHAVLDGKITGWGLPMTGTKIPVSGDHFLLIGDAASLIDPFTGEGIGNALYSGMLAAEAAIKALQEDKFSASFLKENYDDVLFKKIGSELQLSYKMQQLVKYPWLFNMLMNKAQKSPSLQATMTNMFTDLDMRALLKKPSFYWKILVNK